VLEQEKRAANLAIYKGALPKITNSARKNKVLSLGEALAS